ncbi:hypothetical protein Afil01_58610 [Actinorhabdospora filicis]|uniref:Secreted protein n=1 Tax=Actinorhabdospora filicis TaxID=1785913 RepID=A0A9W6SSB0_9ACTN|nr:hypothetical protein [Actinorhabdospora filicis]GLZ81054.1 hypothetical protein Afil01_58610 [Actinorhabdospora filicis]
MRKALTAVAVAAGVAVLGFAGQASASNSGAFAGALSLVNIDASSAAHWQICGQNVLTQSYYQVCDNRDHIGDGPQSGAFAGDQSLGNLDISDAAHWQICGQNVFVVPSLDQQCLNSDHKSHG